MDLIIDVLKDGVHDTLQLIPFLFLTYLAMEALEHSASGKAERIIASADKSGPIVGALLGALPQCGFSAMAATLFSARVITVGTLIAVILSTSDEMVPVFFAHGEPVGRLAAIIGLKVVVGLIVGLVIDAIMRATHHEGDGHAHIHELCERAHCGCDDLEGEEPDAREALDHILHDQDHTHEHAHTHDHAHGSGHGRWYHILRSALIHTVEVTFFIFVISCAFGLVIEYVGEEQLGTFLGIHPVSATLASALIGLIPNCGASVAITELYLSGALATGPMVAGLLASGGVGLLVLFRTNANLRQNLQILAVVYAVSVVSGLTVGALGIIL